MRMGHDAIVAAGFTLQLDYPDLAFGVMAFADDAARVHRQLSNSIEVIDAATGNIPPAAMRMHVC
jgi:hypothetical protein